MTFFIGIVPPKEIYEKVLAIQQSFGNNRIEPHITIRPPVKPVEVDQWLKVIKDTIQTFPAFTIKLTGTGKFSTKVLYIDVQAEALQQLHKTLLKKITPFEGNANLEERLYHPHLTLGRKWCGFTDSDFVSMQQLADEWLANNKNTFITKMVRIYIKTNSTEPYRCFADIALSL